MGSFSTRRTATCRRVTTIKERIAMPEWTDEERELDRALCEFCNTATDNDEPIEAYGLQEWRTFKDLCNAYNNWYAAKAPRPR